MPLNRFVLRHHEQQNTILLIPKTKTTHTHTHTHTHARTHTHTHIHD
jgi:hypothetical protein